MAEENVGNKKQEEQDSELKSKLDSKQTATSLPCGRKCSTGIMVIIVVIGLVVLGAAFAAGRSSSRRIIRREAIGQRAGFQMMGDGGQRMMESGRRGAFGQGIVGTINKVDADNLTVEYNDKTITVTITPDTSIIKSGEIAKQSDLAENQTVSISGTSKSDGSVVATQIRIK